jgi:predicted DNA-binding transcriptional regulator YafY
LYAGVPLYSQRGRGGGWALLDGHKINLSGMTPAEAQALFLVAGPGALTELGVEEGVRSALRKLLSQLPEQTRQHAMKASAAVHFDPARWGREADDPAHLTVLREAVVRGLQVDIDYAKPGQSPEPRQVHPYGLVAKAGTWYLVAGSGAGTRTFRVSRVTRTQLTDQAVVKPDDFDLAEAWEEAQERMSGPPGVLDVELSIDPASQDRVKAMLGWWVDLQPVAGGRYRATFANSDMAAQELARFGTLVTVHQPPEVRQALHKLGAELAAANRPV